MNNILFSRNLDFFALDKSTNLNSVTSSYTLLCIRSYTCHCFFRTLGIITDNIIGNIRMKFGLLSIDDNN